ncbi:MAG: hypothetical protein HY720_14980 [Planctomycetes bacterium]|nr:hypothetical protein [Planctomycetota bacterium]
MRPTQGLVIFVLLSSCLLAQEESGPDERARRMVRAAREFAKGGDLDPLDPPDLENFLANRWASIVTSIAGAVGERAWQEIAAARYGAPDPGEARRAVARMFEKFEFEGIAVFASDVRRFAGDPSVREFLADVVGRLRDPAAELDLWALALERRGGDEREALRLLAVVFQDLEGGPASALHLVEDPVVAESWALALVLVEEADLSRVRLYPGDLDVPDDRWLYHYYVPAELAARLGEDGFETTAAFLAPFVMNTEYERYGIELQGPDAGLLRTARVLWDGPSQPFDEIDLEEVFRAEAIRDIYLGYRGALRGSGSRVPPASFAEVDHGLRRDPRELVRRLAGHME